ncbi:MAG: hypothetical protein PVH84_04620 [Candidatus Aminicenantes bacterium]
MKERKERKGFKILRVRDEREFYSLIEEKMQEEGFEVFETFAPISKESDGLIFF